MKMDKITCENEIKNQKELLKVNEKNLHCSTCKDKAKIEGYIKKEQEMIHNLESKLNSL